MEGTQVMTQEEEGGEEEYDGKGEGWDREENEGTSEREDEEGTGDGGWEDKLEEVWGSVGMREGIG